MKKQNTNPFPSLYFDNAEIPTYVATKFQQELCRLSILAEESRVPVESPVYVGHCLPAYSREALSSTESRKKLHATNLINKNQAPIAHKNVC